MNHVFGIFPVMHGVLGDSEQFAIVSLYELPEGSDAPILAGTDKIQVIATVLTASCAESAVMFVPTALWKQLKRPRT